MSMNVYITATRKITFKKKNGKRSGGIQTTKFDAVQTPTTVTYNIVGSTNPIQSYIDYVKTLSRVEKIPVYAETDIWGEGEPVSYDEYDWAAEHIANFQEWISTVEEDGYTVQIEVI